MRLRSLAFDGSPVSLLNKMFWAIVVIFAVSLCFFGFGYINGSLTAKDAAAAIQSRQADLADALHTGSKSDDSERKQLSGMRASFAFQEKLQQIAKENGCSVNRYQTSPGLKPLLSEANATSGWMQIDVNFILSGSIRSITNTLRDLGTTDIPYQLSAMDISRTKLNAIGQATCSSSVTIALVTRQGEI